MKIVVKMADVADEVELPPSKRSWLYVEVADNGEPTAVSETYTGISNALRAARAKAREFAAPTHVEIERNDSGN